MDHQCKYKDDLEEMTGSGPGENIFWHSVKENVNKVGMADAAIKSFYSEIKDWDFKTSNATANKTFADIGHFTQVVWDASTELGIGIEIADAGTFLVALYKVHGNMEGGNAANVFPPKGPYPKMKDFPVTNQGVGRIITWDTIFIILCALAILRCQYII